MRSRVYRWYGELKYLENELDQDPQAAADAKAIATFIARVDRIEQRATHRKLPLAFSNELYTLREHIALVRRRLLRLAESATESDKPR